METDKNKDKRNKKDAEELDDNLNNPEDGGKMGANRPK